MALSLILHQAIPWFSAAVLGPFLVDPVCHSRIFGRYDIHRETGKPIYFQSGLLRRGRRGAVFIAAIFR